MNQYVVRANEIQSGGGYELAFAWTAVCVLTAWIIVSS